MLYAYAEATVPKLTVIECKAYGGAYCVMSSKHLRTDVNLAWPTAEIAVMGAETAVNVVYRRELEEGVRQAHAVWPSGRAFTEKDKAKVLADTRQEKVEEFRERFANQYVADERGHVDAVINPSETRLHLIRALEMLETKREKIPPKNTATSRCNLKKSRSILEKTKNVYISVSIKSALIRYTYSSS
ncbi:MAG: carboxyl transferase domain-containing protein [Acidobacteriaceae bacterium]